MNLAAFQSAQRAYDNQAPADYEECDADCMLDGNKVCVLYTWCAGEIEINTIVIGEMEFDAYSFSTSTCDDFVAQIRKQEAN